MIWRNKYRIPHRWRKRWYDFFTRIAWWGFNFGIEVKHED